MKDISLILLAAGDSSRFELPVKKQWLRVGELPLWQYVAQNIARAHPFKKIIIAVNEEDMSYCKRLYACSLASARGESAERGADERGSANLKFYFAPGGANRQSSLKSALQLVESELVLVSDVARAQISPELISSLVRNLGGADCISPYLGVNDTTYLGERIVEREELRLIQTPQLSRTALLKKALEGSEIFTDDSAAIGSAGGRLEFIKGEAGALKITRASDLAALNLKPCSRDIFCGTGYDVHALEKGASIVLGGVQIPCEFALIAHSDGDVAIHALIDAICGAAMLGDIGELFPDGDAKLKGADSKELLRKVMRRVRGYGYELVNADITIIAQRPKIGAYKAQMQEVLSEILNCARVNVKATTTEGLGFTGRSEGIAAQAAVSLKFYDWQKHAAKAQDV
ncbi:bifunctional 2-C-methyl-D-erythritol 4-phosphate cytidylyltransferase/2-C-methyl-D-erythritol 2,4-cyclodiphosphate synthase [uncultured Campylobacter sp.]|uniref:bifunctional 2-C-methyl-D-erythritol 4-phosphate cytidylyltransferase/2-C-methyl-D-erythritol 2,4-cyclodiphosphate synthase n=1 Tax=uncultured Campylobacter sp. TaxID=218934 RepID=UPI002632DC97|nr:bifunctional 2-C-methyl-D-erythritol 4-phosphate cytidylyltransferase/2-C-methyl-D-erythritol 2,4-cyclodiphosphate synthase [uncultured Campylobacter sp.]